LPRRHLDGRVTVRPRTDDSDARADIASGADHDRAPRAEQELVRRLYATLHGGGNVDAAREILSDDYLDHDLPGIGEGVASSLRPRDRRVAVPDIRPSVVQAVAEGDLVAARVVAEGTHSGAPFPPGIPAAGSRLHWQECHIYRIADGRIAEHWGVNDMLTILTQLGAMPAPS
jgi:predicted ester cyclase